MHVSLSSCRRVRAQMRVDGHVGTSVVAAGESARVCTNVGLERGPGDGTVQSGGAHAQCVADGARVGIHTGNPWILRVGVMKDGEGERVNSRRALARALMTHCALAHATEARCKRARSPGRWGVR